MIKRLLELVPGFPQTRTEFPGYETNIFMNSQEVYTRMRRHKKRHPRCVLDIGPLLISRESVAVQWLSNCKGIFLLFPDGSKGVTHLWPSPAGFAQLNANITQNHRSLSFKDAIPVIVSSSDRFVSDKQVHTHTAHGYSISFEDLGLDIFYSHLATALPGLNIDRTLFFAHDCLQKFTIELNDQGLQIFDYSQVITPGKQTFIASTNREIGIRPAAEVVAEVQRGLDRLNQKLIEKGVLTLPTR